MEGAPESRLPCRCTWSLGGSSNGNIPILLPFPAGHSWEAHITAQVRWERQQARGNILDQAGPTQQIEVRQIRWEASRWRHPLLGRRYDKEGTSPQGVDLRQTEFLQRSSKGTNVPPCALHGFQCVGERLHKRVLPRMQLHIFPPTTTETCINSLLEVTTPTREGEK